MTLRASVFAAERFGVARLAIKASVGMVLNCSRRCIARSISGDGTALSLTDRGRVAAM